MAHMVDAAVGLLRKHPPDDVTVRDIAVAAGHHHRFVVAWFGGKAGLFDAAFDQLALEAAEAIGFPASRDSISPEVVRVIQLMNWLVAQGPAALSHRRRTPLIDRLATIYEETFRLPPNLARLLAQRTMATVISMVLYPGPLGIGAGDIQRHIELELRLAALLSEAAGRG